MQTAIEFLNQTKTKHGDDGVCSIVVYPLHEPLEFKAQFLGGWSSTNYLRKKGVSEFEEWIGQPVQDVLKEYTQDRFALDQLVPGKLPKGVDPTKLEMYLSDPDFEKAFKMTRKSFEKYSQWKQAEIKKSVSLF